jgi:hypothetical protein
MSETETNPEANDDEITENGEETDTEETDSDDNGGGDADNGE